MIIEDICRVKLDKKSIKFICDLLINDYIEQGADRRSVRELQNTMLSDLDHNMLSKYLMILKFDLALQKSFETEYKELEAVYKMEGCKGVLQSTKTLEKLCRAYFSNEKKLFGEQLESAINIQVEYVSNEFKLSAWNDAEFGSFLTLLNNSVKKWVDRSTVTQNRLLGADVSNVINTTDREGMSASIVDEVATFEVHKGYSDMLDPELYTRLISSIKKGTKLLFPLSSSSNIRGEIYSILNYYFEMEYKNYCKRLADIGFDVKFDVNVVTPHKVKHNTRLMEGHLVTVNPSYASSGIGNVDNCNKTVDVGKIALKDYIDAIEYAKGRLKPNQELVACFIAMDVMNYMIRENPYNAQRLDFLSVVTVIDSIICAEQLISVLKDNGLSILCFPIIEVREGTWTRFSCIYELVNFYRTHARLDDLVHLNLSNREYAKIKADPVNILDIMNRQQAAQRSNYEAYLEANFSRLQLDNRCNISSIKKDDTHISGTQSDSLKSVFSCLMHSLYSSGKSILEVILPYLGDQDFLFAMELFSAVYIPLLSKANSNFAYCDFHQSQLLDLLSINNGVVLSGIVDDQIDYMNNLVGSDYCSDYAKEITEYITTLEAIKKKRDYKSFNQFLDVVDFRMYSIISKYENLPMYFQKDYRLSRGVYFVYCNIKLGEYLYTELSNLVCRLFNSGDIDISTGTAKDDLEAALYRHDNNMLKLILNITKYNKCDVFYSSDIDSVLDDFVDWISKELSMRITSKARLKDFITNDMFYCNTSAVEHISKIIREAIKCIDNKLMSKLSKSLDRGIQENYWNSVKDRISRDFFNYSSNVLSESLYDNTYNADIEVVDALRHLPTLRNSTIIGLTEPYKQHMRDGGEYFIFSNLGYKMLLQSRLGEVEPMTEDDINLILSVSEWR